MKQSIIISLALMLVICLTGCEKDLPINYEFEPYAYGSADETGGTWKTILLTSPDQISIPAPEAVNSAAYQAELNALVSTTANLTGAQRNAVQYWGSNSVVRWNEIARELAAKYNLAPAPKADGSYPGPNAADPGVYPLFPFAHPPYASRMFAYWSAAQMDGLIAAWHYKYQFQRPAPSVSNTSIKTSLPLNNLPSYPADGAVVAAISQTILSAMFPLEKAFIEGKAAEHRQTLEWSGLHVASDVTAGDSLGRAVAAVFMARAKTDGMGQAQTSKAVSDSLRAEAQARFGWNWINLEDPPRPVGITPFLGKVKPWCIPNVETVRPVPPPSPNSPEFKTDADELKSIANNLTEEQRAIANFWADGLGTYTPPGHWNRLASEFMVTKKQNPLRSARTFAYLNMTEMDAGISCWDAKYYYHYPRPSQLIPGFKTILGIPNFPSYTSGHSTFSAAAAEVLGHLYPEEKGRCDAWAEEAAMSRIYAGIHYRFDAEAGLTQGRAVGNYAVEVAKKDGAN